MSSLMRFTLPVCLSLFVVLHSSSFAAKPPAPPANARTIQTLPDFPLAHLKMSLSPRLYKSLLISPLTAWAVTPPPVNEGAEPKMVHSEAGGVFDKLALEMAKGWGSVGYNTIESRT